ncbi:MAG: phosphoglycerate dehydrogenase [candidate division Zixibacteria bacterium]|nr:phosphoglycerate dehydrogenase [candidate division Zixibacteria bacterium]
MRKALVGSRSFGEVVSAGEKPRTKASFEVSRVSPEERPLDASKMTRIIARDNPDVIICGAEPVTAGVLRASKKLRMVMKHGVGVDNIDLDAATNLHIVVANAPGTNAAAVADLTLSAALALLRGYCEASSSTKAGAWKRYMGHELGEMTVGIVGTGHIGTEVIKRLQGFGAKMLAYDVVKNVTLESKYTLSYVTLQELLETSDIVTLHVTLSEQTRKMISARELEMMKESAYFINTARGELVDEGALYNCLKAMRIAGAALDVLATEPPQSSPILQLDNVLATPHIAAYTYEAMARMDRTCAETIVDTFRGKRCPNVLNPVVYDSFQV